MNKNVTSRQELIDAAMEISRTEGVHKVNIRNIAKKCSISVGVLYNYFPTKTDLIFAVWKASGRMFCAPLPVWNQKQPDLPTL